jgi:hypothetical protein
MKNKYYKGLVVVAPPHLNPLQEPDHYVFSGVEVPSNEIYICSFRVLPLPGYVMPAEFAAVVEARKPLRGDMELFAPDWSLGVFSYVRLDSGDTVSARASDAMQLSKEQLLEPKQEPERARTRPPLSTPKTKEQEVIQEPPPPPQPDPYGGMDMSF